MKLSEKRREIRGVRRLAIVIACAAFGVTACSTALALAVHVDAPASAGTTNRAQSHSQPIEVSAHIMAGQKIGGPNPKYPEAAKKKKIQGKVVLDVLIGKDGNVKSVKANSGPKELRDSAIDAVRQWKYKPYLLNGEPVEVKSTVNVIYTLAG